MSTPTARQVSTARVKELITREEEAFRKARPRSHKLWEEARQVMPAGVTPIPSWQAGFACAEPSQDWSSYASVLDPKTNEPIIVKATDKAKNKFWRVLPMVGLSWPSMP